MFTSVKRVSDILPVEGHTGQDAYGLTMKQLTALGCPRWDSDGSFFGKGSQPHRATAEQPVLGRGGFGPGVASVSAKMRSTATVCPETRGLAMSTSG